MSTARPLREDLITQAALEAYGPIRHEGRPADLALDRTLRSKRALHSRERRVVSERIYALLRRQIAVDFLLEKERAAFLALPSSQQDLLRLAAIRSLLGEPAAAVAAQMRLSKEDAAALARLPEAERQIASLEPRRRFAVLHSLPEFLAARFAAEFGEDADRAAEAMNERAPLTARVNTLKSSRETLLTSLRSEAILCRPTPLSPLGVILESRPNAFSLRAFKQGQLELQDEGSQLLGMLVDPPPKIVVDACAGAGGKTLQLAAAMKNRGELYAFDVSERRLEELRKRARRAGVYNVRIRPTVSGEEARAAGADLIGRAHRVLVDAPCSGSGALRRNPDARYRLTAEEVRAHAERQKRLLSAFAELVRPGGRLVYGTCSVLREENEEVVEDFLRRRPDFTLLPIAEVLGDELARRLVRDGYLRLAPHLHGTDGFFGAALQRSVADHS
ncbi:MAG TPA: methyltransferase domain-containing protein [Myxococcaceae bacterium]|nr:methyltransferase domain-containing protein [Myxococcaceae bacterium]